MATGKLIHQQYGKARVRVLKVFRQGARHEIREIEVSVMLEGDFTAAYTHADNRLVVATDTMKNTVYVLAQDFLNGPLEKFVVEVGRHFVSRYSQVSHAVVEVREQAWERMTVDGQPHEHSFVGGGPAKQFTRATCERDGARVESGVEDLLILKSTGSGFAGFTRDEFTTLAETADRILCTRLKACWQYDREPVDFARARAAILSAMLRVFAVNYSPSVQATLYEMAGAALEAAPEIGEVSLALPNQHCLPVNLWPFGRENKNEIFVPTTEPHGQIEATVARAAAGG